MSSSSSSFDAKTFEQGVRRAIPSEFYMISGSEDSQEAQEIYNAASKFDLPYVKGKEGGLCTSLLLHSLYAQAHRVVAPHAAPSTPLTCQELMHTMYATSKSKGYTPVPQMTASRPLVAARPFYIVPPGYTGRRRALIIGINYTGQSGQLRAPQNDAHNVQQFLIQACGFDPAEMLVLVDDDEKPHAAPTKRNMLMGLQQMVQYSRPGDVLVVSFSGHGGRVTDKDGDEEDGYDSTLMPVDFATAGQVVDDDLLKYFIKGLPAGVHTTMLVDACHCGSVGDLPYTLAANARKYSVEQGFNMQTHAEALAADQKAREAEQERKRAKAERAKEREAIRQRRAEQEAAEAAALGAGVRGNQTAPVLTLQANSPEELQALASKFGGMMHVSPAQAAALAKQGGGTISSGPIMMTPQQAAAFSAQHSPVQVGSPVAVKGRVGAPNSPTKIRSPTRTKAAPSSPTKIHTTTTTKHTPTSPSKMSSPTSKKPPYTTTTNKRVPASKTTVKHVPATSSVKRVLKTTTTTPPKPIAVSGGGVSALRSKFGG